ncbi:MAG: hypothetical protein IJV85_01295 [Clostridia bacterium]|nr:hypothetical protein [Clostridia bacterium]
MSKIVVTNWNKEQHPICSEFCELINDALERRPDMSLAEFAEILNEANQYAMREMLYEVEKRQLKEIKANASS